MMVTSARHQEVAVSTLITCKDCGATIAQCDEKALDGTWAVVWSDDGGEWVCPVTGNEHVPGEYAGERDHAGNPICGRDFMAGTICTDAPGHEGPHSPVCQVCEGDWYDGTCTCFPYCAVCGVQYDPDEIGACSICESCGDCCEGHADEEDES
jgi:hypothetical protein